MAVDGKSGKQSGLLDGFAVLVKPAHAGETFAPAVGLLFLGGEKAEQGDCCQDYYQEGWKYLIDGGASKHPL